MPEGAGESVIYLMTLSAGAVVDLGGDDGLEGAARWAEVARIFSEQGFMADAGTAPDGTPELRLHHCPLRSTAEVTDVPCRAEVALAEALVGQPLRRVEHGARDRGICRYSPASSARNL